MNMERDPELNNRPIWTSQKQNRTHLTLCWLNPRLLPLQQTHCPRVSRSPSSPLSPLGRSRVLPVTPRRGLCCNAATLPGQTSPQKANGPKDSLKNRTRNLLVPVTYLGEWRGAGEGNNAKPLGKDTAVPATYT